MFTLLQCLYWTLEWVCDYCNLTTVEVQRAMLQITAKNCVESEIYRNFHHVAICTSFDHTNTSISTFDGSEVRIQVVALIYQHPPVDSNKTHCVQFIAPTYVKSIAE